MNNGWCNQKQYGSNGFSLTVLPIGESTIPQRFPRLCKRWWRADIAPDTIAVLCGQPGHIFSQSGASALVWRILIQRSTSVNCGRATPSFVGKIR